MFDIIGKDDVIIPGWMDDAYNSFKSILLDDPHNTGEKHPCYFARNAIKNNDLFYTFLNNEEIESPESLVIDLVKFRQISKKSPKRNALVVLIQEIQKGGIDNYRNSFWSIMQYLHDNDPGSWPSEKPIQTDDPKWQFYFDNEPWFVNCHCPKYRNRLSRKSISSWFIVFQTKENLKDITGTSKRAAIIRETIRSNIDSYDLIRRSPELGIYEDTESREWRQYWLPDDNSSETRTCPLIINKSESNG